MTAPRRRYPQSLKDEVVKNIIDTSRPIKDVAAEYGVGAETARVLNDLRIYWNSETPKHCWSMNSVANPAENPAV
ncbi:transposase [Glutamicibacter uratoxydans]|uniref:transposase n=1 Tax=Glutamicibacter uratoxydans TaxID=43667 RepID=UPI003D6E0597